MSSADENLDWRPQKYANNLFLLTTGEGLPGRFYQNKFPSEISLQLKKVIS